MASQPPVNKKLITYGGLAVVIVAIWFLTDKPAERPAPGPRRPPAGARSSSSSKSAGSIFVAEDYNTKFANLNLPVKNAFRPLVVPAAPGSAGISALAPNEIPKDFADGKDVWTYTGTAIVDGVPMALVENAATGEGEFLKVGQRWKKAVVRKITPITLVMEGPNGRVRTMDLLKEVGDGEDETTLAGAEVRPVSPNISGTIPGPRPTRNTPGSGVNAQENQNDQNISAD